MALTRSVVEQKAEEYADEEPFYTVESEEIESLGEALASGDFGWRDAEWVVQWYYRRYLGAFPNDRRRDLEDAYGENDYEAVRDALAAAAEADETREALAALTTLSGVDVAVASAFLMFLNPDDYLVVGHREWTALQEAGELDEPVPDTVTPADYARYLAACREVGDRLDCSMWTLYQALWRRWKDDHE